MVSWGGRSGPPGDGSVAGDADVVFPVEAMGAGSDGGKGIGAAPRLSTWRPGKGSTERLAAVPPFIGGSVEWD